MQISELMLNDTVRSRIIPVSIYMPDNASKDKRPVVIFNPGYQTQEDLCKDNIKLGYKTIIIQSCNLKIHKGVFLKHPSYILTC